VTDAGKLIVLNGPSSAGKTTLCRALQAALPEPFLHFSLDFFMFDTSALPPRRADDPAFAWRAQRAKVFQGYYNCLAALAKAGNNVVTDYIIETSGQFEALRAALEGLDVFLVGVHCNLAELERREQARGDRRVGDARRDLETVHTFTPYDFEVDSALEPERNARAITAVWIERGKRSRVWSLER
jgi:chloramphenicol 3-O phosphotransferase